MRMFCYCHVLNPRTALPVNHWRKVSVLTPLAVVAGNCSTIAMLKESEGLGFLEACGIEYLAVDRYGIRHTRDITKARELR